MLPFKRVLFPVDYSPSCTATVPYVTDMTRHFSAELTLVHAYALRPAFAGRDFDGVLAFSDVYNGPAYDPRSLEEARLAEGQRLREFAAKMFPGQHVDVMAEEGEAGAVDS